MPSCFCSTTRQPKGVELYALAANYVICPSVGIFDTKRHEQKKSLFAPDIALPATQDTSTCQGPQQTLYTHLSHQPTSRPYKINENKTVMMIRSTNTLRMEKRGAILLVALSRTNKHNAFNDELYTDLVNTLDDSASDNSILAVVLTGGGKYFSSGADLTDANSSFLPDEDGNSRDTLNKPAGKFMMAMLRFPKVLVAAVNGPAVGIAVTLLLHCDLVYITPRVTLWAPFTRLALVPEFCSSVTFIERMGLPKANVMLLLGQKVGLTNVQ